ncbi:MAG: hypothetical protein HOP29_04615 [Phycisphaerales bacterium]|nr:hypothetical protein [Phycisphaerales bacterium]
MRTNDWVRIQMAGLSVIALAAGAVSHASGQTRELPKYYDIDPSWVPGQEGPSTAGENQLSCTFHDGLCDDDITPCSADPECAGIGNQLCMLGIAGDENAYGGLIGVLSDLNGGPDADDPSVLADNFRFLTLGDIPQIEWTGYYRRLAGGAFGDCTVADVQNGDRFTIAMLGNDNGLPDGNNILFQDSQSATPARFVTGVNEGLLFGPRVILRNTYNFPGGSEFVIGSVAMRYLAVVNDTTPNAGTSSCRWFWRQGPPGDIRRYATDQADLMSGWVEEGPTSANPADFSYCIGYNSSGSLELQPGVEADALGPPDDSSLCCDIRITVQNRSFTVGGPGPLAINEFYVAVNKGDGPATCEALSDVFPPAGWTLSLCEGWSGGQTVLHFTGGTLVEQEKVSFIIRTRINDNIVDPVQVEEEVTGNILMEEIPARGIRAWATKDDVLVGCGGGPNVGPQVGGLGEWGPGDDGLCALVPVPSASTSGKMALAAMLIAGGLFLVLRSRSIRTA